MQTLFSTLICLKTLTIWTGLAETLLGTAHYVRRLNQQAYFCQFWSVQIRIKYGACEVRSLN